tara:strand:- start:1060 stop:1974 length:915 start_codon:yes stop_codon:yes gene_type:complete
MPRIKNMGTATMRFKEGTIVSGNAAQDDGSYSNYSLVVTGSQIIDATGGGGLTIFKEEADSAFLRFVNSDDPTSWYAYFAFDSAENIYLFPGRSQDFNIRTRTNVGSDPIKFPFRIYNDGKAKFEHGQDDTASSVAAMPNDVVFFVSGSKDAQNNAVFGGDVVISGSLSAMQKHVINLKYTATSDANKKYVRFGSNGSNDSPGVNNKWIPPVQGNLLQVVIRSTGTPGNTTLGFHRATDGTEDIPTSAIETQSINLSAANTSAFVNFTPGANFGPGDIVGFSVDPTNNHGNVNITLVFELDFAS